MKAKHFALAALCLFCGAVGADALAWDMSPLGGIETAYSRAITDRIQKSEDEFQAKAALDENGFGFVCLADVKNDYYIGAAQYYMISASIETVGRYVQSFENYPKWFDGLVSCAAEKKSDTRYLVSSEQNVPIPFVSNVRYQMMYAIESEEKRQLFRYQLIASESINAYDGFILLEKIDESHTQVTEYDFIDAKWGMAKVQGKKAIWSDSLLGMYQTDLALKIRSESPDLPDKEVLQLSKKKTKAKSFSDCIEHKTVFPTTRDH